MPKLGVWQNFYIRYLLINNFIIKFIKIASTKDKMSCKCHSGVFDFGHTGNTVTDALGKYDTKNSVI